MKCQGYPLDPLREDECLLPMSEDVVMRRFSQYAGYWMASLGVALLIFSLFLVPMQA